MGGCVLCATNVLLKICLTVATLQVSAVCICSTGTWLNLPEGTTGQSPRQPSGLWYDIHCIHVMFQCNFICSVNFIQANKLSIKDNPFLFRAKISLCLLVFRKRNGFSNSVIVVCVVFLT